MRVKTFMQWGAVSLMLSFSSCSVFYPSVMLRTGKNFPYDETPKEPEREYRIAPNDLVFFRIFANDGFKLIDLTGVQSQFSQSGIYGLTYLVEHDGQIKLPILGRVALSGKTLREAEMMLEDKYSQYYNKPFVLLDITNRRVVVFPGNIGTAQVLQLQNNNTTVLEALALAGGITGKAKRIKLIRGNKVFLLDLSTVEQRAQGDILVQANDIIYVEPVFKISTLLLAEMSPYIAILTNLLLIISIFTLK